VLQALPLPDVAETAEPQPAEPELAARLRACGLRVTAPRLAVLAVASERPHLDADGIAEIVRPRLGAISTQAIYDNLHVLVGAGLLRRIEPAGGAARYEARVGDNHHHMVCRTCGATCDVDCAVGFAPCLEASDTHGFAVDEAEVTFWGTCPRCQEPSDHTSNETNERTRDHQGAP